jgi:hypothetical protein
MVCLDELKVSVKFKCVSVILTRAVRTVLHPLCLGVMDHSQYCVEETRCDVS